MSSRPRPNTDLRPADRAAAARLRDLTRLSRAVSQAASLETILELAVTQAAGMLNADQALLLLIGDDGVARVYAARGIPDEITKACVGRLDEQFIERLEQRLTIGTARSFLAVPLVVQGAVTGLLAVVRPADAPWGPEEEATLSALADQSAAPIEIARLSEAVRQAALVTENLRLEAAERAAREALETSEAEYQATFELLATGQALVEMATGRFQRVNRKMCELTGYTTAELASLSVSDITHPEDRAASQAALLTLQEGHAERVEFEARFVRRNGPWFWASVNAQRLPDAEGNTTRYVAAFQNISAWKFAEDALRRREQQFASLAESSPDLIARYDREGRLVYVNSAVAAMTGNPPESYLGRTVHDATGLPGFDPQWREVIEAVFQTGSARELEVDFPSPTGRRQFHVRFVPERAEGGNVAFVISIARDFTAHREVEDRLRQAAKMEAVGRLAGGLAHDFNNQLFAVQGFARYVAQDGGLEPAAQQDLREIQKATDRMADLTRQLLAFSRQQVLTPETIDLDHVINDGRELLQRLIGRHIDLRVEPGPGRKWVKADRTQVLQILMNLCINARDAMPDGGMLEVRTRCRTVTGSEPGLDRHGPVDRGEYVELVVSDTGTGIDPEHLPHIFEPFFTTKETGRGTGLGLATVHGIVTQGNGHIWATSAPGHGTRLTVLLPSAPEPASPDRADAVPISAAASRARILVVEDEEMVRALLVRTLRDAGYQVVQATNGREALEHLAQPEQNIALVLTDVVMPVMGGKELAGRLACEHPDLPIVWMSGYPRDTAFVGGEVSLEKPFLQKPIAPETLIETIRAMLQRAGTNLPQR